MTRSVNQSSGKENDINHVRNHIVLWYTTKCNHAIKKYMLKHIKCIYLFILKIAESNFSDSGANALLHYSCDRGKLTQSN